MNFWKRFWLSDEVLVGSYFMTRAEIIGRLFRWLLGYSPIILIAVLIYLLTINPKLAAVIFIGLLLVGLIIFKIWYCIVNKWY